MSRMTKALRAISADDASRFNAKVDRSGGPDACWPWMASTRDRGYGQFSVGGREGAIPPTHRLAFVLATGQVPADDVCVLHRCDNPPCCNPAHLFLGTRADNAHDRDSKGRGTAPPVTQGEQHYDARLTETDVRAIREATARGESQTWIAKRFGVSATAIRKIDKRQTWRHVA
jgi:hypothetical protein